MITRTGGRARMIRRFAAGIVASGLAFGSGWLVVRAGGLVDRAPHIVILMLGTLSGAVIFSTVIAGYDDDAIAVVIDVILALAAFYLASWVFSPVHSVAGDIYTILGAWIPLGVGASTGFGIGRLALRLRARPGLSGGRVA